MGFLFKISLPTKRDIEKIFKGKGRSAKKKRKTLLFVLVILFLFLLGFIYVLNKGTDAVKSQETVTQGNKEDFELHFSQKINYRSDNPNEWLYASSNIDYSEAYSLIVLNENSSYSQLASRKEKSKWVSDYLDYFGWVDEEGATNEPAMISLSDALDVGSYCGFSTTETLELLKNKE